MKRGLRLGRRPQRVLLGALGCWALWTPGQVRAQALSLQGSASGRAEADPEAGLTGSTSSQGSAEGGQKRAIESAPPAATGTSGTTQASGPTHQVRPGDTLWGVSQTYYRDAYQWPRLWSYNPEITNPHFIYPGDVLRLGPGQDVPAIAGADGASRRPVSRHPPPRFQLREQAYLDSDALQQAGVIVGSSATHMLLSASDEVFVKFEQPPRAPVGKELTVYRHVTHSENSSVAAKPYEYDPDNPGAIVRVLGTVRVLSFDPETKVAKGEIMEALDVIERGFRVAEAPRRFVQVTPRTNEKTLESTVVAAMRPVELIGQNQVVFLGVGNEQGVKPGNRFFVVRRQDGWRNTLPKRSEAVMGAERPASPLPDESTFPEDILAEIVVLHTRPQSATGVVTHAIREIAPGDRVRMPDGY